MLTKDNHFVHIGEMSLVEQLSNSQKYHKALKITCFVILLLLFSGLTTYVVIFTEVLMSDIENVVPDVVKDNLRPIHVNNSRWMYLDSTNRTEGNRGDSVSLSRALQALDRYETTKGKGHFDGIFESYWERENKLVVESEVRQQSRMLIFINSNVFRVIITSLGLLGVGFFYRLFRYHLRFSRYYDALIMMVKMETSKNKDLLFGNPDLSAKILAILNPSHIDIGTFKNTPPDPFPDVMKSLLGKAGGGSPAGS